jgi:hypothetical protein
MYAHQIVNKTSEIIIIKACIFHMIIGKQYQDILFQILFHKSYENEELIQKWVFLSIHKLCNIEKPMML